MKFSKIAVNIIVKRATMEGLGLTAGGPGDRKQMDHLAFEVRNVEAL